MPNLEELAKLIAVILAAMAPIIALLGWLVKVMATNHTKGLLKVQEGLSETSAALQEHMTDAAHNQKDIVRMIGEVIHKEKNTAQIVSSMHEVMRDGQCPFGAVEADMMKRAAKKELGKRD